MPNIDRPGQKVPQDRHHRCGLRAWHLACPTHNPLRCFVYRCSLPFVGPLHALSLNLHIVGTHPPRSDLTRVHSFAHSYCDTLLGRVAHPKLMVKQQAKKLAYQAPNAAG